MPSSMMSTRSAAEAADDGRRLASGPKLRLATPGSCSSASPTVVGGSRAIWSESTVVTALNDCRVAASPTAVAVTVTSSAHRREIELEVGDGGPPSVTVTVWLAASRRPRCAVTTSAPAGTLLISNAPSSVSADAPVPG